MAISYLVHDLADPAVARRVAVLQRGGVEIDLLRFRRSAVAPASIAGVPARDLGQTQDGRFIARILSVLRSRLRSGSWATGLSRADGIVARNLEMLYLAAAARQGQAAGKPLYYELLDIHRLMIGEGLPGRLLRRLEAHLLRQCAGVIISSPAFEREYLRRFHTGLPPILLWENKVMPAVGEAAPMMPPPPAPGRPWRIGWFGAIRCRRSLLCLAEIARQHPGLIEVDIRGRVTDAMGPDFQAIVDAAPGITYHGPYRYPDDLAAIYGQVHLVWAIDFYEAGFNSTWLLPNRLYEGGYCRRVPIAIKTVETGRWLAAQGLGLLIDDDLEKSATNLLLQLTEERYQSSLAASLTASADLFRLDDQACRDMAADIRRG